MSNTEEKVSGSSSSSADEENFVHVQSPDQQQVVDSTTTDDLVNVEGVLNNLSASIAASESSDHKNDQQKVNQLIADITNTSKVTEADSTTSETPAAAAAVIVDDKSSKTSKVQEPVKPSAPSAESSRIQEPPKPSSEASSQSSTSSSQSSDPSAKLASNKKCSTCPVGNYCDHFMQKLDSYPKVRDLLLWKDPKITASVFVSELVLLYTLATYPFLSIIGFIILFTMILVGSYRLYLAILFRVKGTPDETFNKLSSTNISIPKDKLDSIVNMIDTCGNKSLNQLKLLILWDNTCRSAVAFVAIYVLYSIACTFNTITLITFGVIDAFVLPKVYTLYKPQIDSVFNKIHEQVIDLIIKTRQRFPKLFPKKAKTY